MSYRCEVCTGVAPPGTPELHHVVKRRDGQIARVLRVCEDCQSELRRGTTLADLCRRLRAPAVPLPREAPKPAAPVAGGKRLVMGQSPLARKHSAPAAPAHGNGPS